MSKDTLSGNVVYIYDAEGNKLQKQVMNGSSLATTDYFGAFQYQDGTLDFLAHSEGYVKAINLGNTTEYHYVYHYKDHLGNIRLSYGRDPETNEVAILKESHYYPFGLEHQGYVSNHKMFEAIPIGEPRASLLPVRNYLDDSYRYTFGGKEAQPELGLNWLDFHARNYDAALGRWINVDPLAEKYLSWSPYNYVMNNPLKHTDPTGMMIEPPTQPGKLEGETHYDEDTGASYEWDGEGGWHSDLQGGEELNEVVVTNEESSDREGSSGEEAGKPSSGVFNAAVGGLGLSISIKNELIDFAGKGGGLDSGTMKYLKYSKGLGTVANVVGVGNAGIKYYNEPSAGNATRLAVQGTAIGTAFIPGVGWVISLGISTADMIWGDQFYNWIDD